MQMFKECIKIIIPIDSKHLYDINELLKICNILYTLNNKDNYYLAFVINSYWGWEGTLTWERPEAMQQTAAIQKNAEARMK